MYCQQRVKIIHYYINQAKEKIKMWHLLLLLLHFRKTGFEGMEKHLVEKQIGKTQYKKRVDFL